MQIAYIVEPRKVIGGGVKAAINLADSMKAFGFNCSIFGVYAKANIEKRIDITTVDTLKPISIDYLRSLRNFLNSTDPEIVHCLGLFSALVCVLLRQLCSYKFKIVLTVHRVPSKVRFQRISKNLNGYIGRKVDYVTFLTNYQREHYNTKLNLLPKNTSIVPNVVAFPAIDCECVSKLNESLREITHSDLLFVYVGRLIKSKNIEFFIRVIAELHKSGINAGGVIVGGGDAEYKRALEMQVAETKLTDNVKFIGFVNNPLDYISASDFILFPTLTEALPNLLIESFACGKIVFASDIPQLKDLIENGVNGFALSLDNFKEFTKVIVDTICNAERRQRIEENAKKTYNDSFDPYMVSFKYKKIYESL